MHVVVVESPAKAKTVLGLLGTGHTVIATRGHVKDLPAKNGSVDPARGFALVYATNRRATRTLRSIAAALREADALVLATDPDREGEAIAWQVLTWLEDNDALRGKPVHRLLFHEVTADAVRAAMDRSRAYRHGLGARPAGAVLPRHLGHPRTHRPTSLSQPSPSASQGRSSRGRLGTIDVLLPRSSNAPAAS